MAERLGVSQRYVVQNFDMQELIEWMAYDMASDDEFRKKVTEDMAIENQKNRTPEQEAAAMKAFFMGVR